MKYKYYIKIYKQENKPTVAKKYKIKYFFYYMELDATKEDICNEVYEILIEKYNKELNSNQKLQSRILQNIYDLNKAFKI